MKTKLITILEDLEKLDHFPKLGCPFCKTGQLIVDSTEKIDYINVISKKNYDFIGEPTILIGEYSFLLVCNDLECGEKGIVVGKTGTVEDGYDNGFDPETGQEMHSGGHKYKSRYKISYISIPIRLIEIPENMGDQLKSCIESSFILFWVDLNSCGNRIRSFIELLLDFINVPKKSSLGARITHLQGDIGNPYHLLAKSFMAIKYFGNESTHAFDQIEREDIVKSYSVVEHCLRKIYSDHDLHIEILTNELEVKYNPRKKQ